MLTVHVVLDRSGSMNSIRNDAIGGFNSYVEQLAKEQPDAILSLTTFSTDVTNVVNVNKITEVPHLTDETYRPGGWTALYDAIGNVIQKLEQAPEGQKVLVILTDGQENASKEYTQETIRKLIEEKQEKDNWLVLYLGANQDAFAEGKKFGTVAANTLQYSPDMFGATMDVAFASTARFAESGGSRLKAAFSSEERARTRS